MYQRKDTILKEKNLSNHEQDDISSQFGKLLRDTPWLPSKDKSGEFYNPCDLKLDELPDSFERDEEVADRLEMKKDINIKLAEQAGITTNDINLIQQLKDNPDIYHRVRSDLEENEKPSFPVRNSNNPDRRQKRLLEQVNEAPQKQYENRNRNVRSTKGAIEPKQRLSNQYTNDKQQMVCQICEKEMPFRKRDGEYYFEHVEALPNDYFNKEHEAQHLALCPLCAAKYKEFVKHDDDSMEDLKSRLLDAEEPIISLKLGDENTTLRFVETHFLAIKEIIEENECGVIEKENEVA